MLHLFGMALEEHVSSFIRFSPAFSTSPPQRSPMLLPPQPVKGLL